MKVPGRERQLQESVLRIRAALLEEIAAEPAKTKAFPDLREKFREVLERLDQEPAVVTIDHPRRDIEVTITLRREAFCEALRSMMYTMSTNRQVPMLFLLQYFWLKSANPVFMICGFWT